MAHEMFLQLLHRKLYLAPIKNPQRVIDLGLAQVSGQLIDFGNFVCWVWWTQDTDADSLKQTNTRLR
ncbi:hypothetical protein VTN31DRAFT_1516 [Thermomyces dupontii]|uniref:uncharacterized protein n=1 Tax=Talaromyces thermophilus TaxID=28565 RepID=UPI0037438A06